MTAPADAAQGRRSNPEFDRPEERHPVPRRVKLLGGRVALHRIDDSGKYLEHSPATRGVKGITLFRVVYRANYPIVPPRSGDVRASVTIGRAIFHDGYAWDDFIGPFTATVTSAPSSCYVKEVFLPTKDRRYAVGKTVAVRVNLPRTRQRLTLPATIIAGSKNPSGGAENPNGPEQAADVAALGCPVGVAGADDGAGFLHKPPTPSPASFLPYRYAVPRLPERAPAATPAPAPTDP
ncbi:hypothetical protein [Patulibacter americanus]|uniref:hypothetical protein n=1 Tax=Patulibacter americanus TaxID=588672 RepID=UPI00146C22B3|nr:hypothetical protein [Patulibacter americanus]